MEKKAKTSLKPNLNRKVINANWENLQAAIKGSQDKLEITKPVTTAKLQGNKMQTPPTNKVMLKKLKQNEPSNKITTCLAMDCEMVGVGLNGLNHMLARVSIVMGKELSEEFIEVYNDLFGDDADLNTKKKAFEMLLVWRIRCCDGTPASVLSTLELLNVELKRNNSNLSGELQTMYSDAFTKFINYMTSVTQVKQFKTLYNSAKELGLESFLIDLRHLCAHGQTSPSTEVLLRSATYCMKWLKEFYWDRQLELLAKVSLQELRPMKSLTFENYLKELYRIYDIASEAIHKGYQTVEDKIYLHDGTSSLDVLRSYAEDLETTNLAEIRQAILKNFSSVINENSLPEKYEIVSKIILFDSHYFLVSPSLKRKSKLSPIELYQSLFRVLASVGAIEELFRCTVRVLESFEETGIRRKGALYWGLQILNGLSMMKKFKKSVFIRANQNPSFKINNKLVNKETHSVKLKNIYDEWGATPSNTLLFCDTDNRPIQLRIMRNFLRTRLLKADEISKEFCLRCFEEVEPPLTTDEVDSLICLLDSYVPQAMELVNDGEMGINDEPDNDDINTTEMFEKRSWRTSNEINWSQVAFGASPN